MKSTFFFLALGVFSFVYAQNIQVTVIDTDLSIPLEGAQLFLNENFLGSTDDQGAIFFDFPFGTTQALLVTKYPGYAENKTTITNKQQNIVVLLSLADVIEGKELLVVQTSLEKNESSPAVSIVMSQEEMKTTANFGLVEDVMSSIKTLPGIGFTGSFNAQPSIRGGYPEEMGTVLDDISVLEPWHWGGAFSIFNPNMVSSAKMSHGIFSVRYGRALSGLLEVTTKDIGSSKAQFDAGFSTNAIDLFVSVPITQNLGFFVGGKVSFLEPEGFLHDEVLGLRPLLKETIPTLPYIRDLYAKTYFIPFPTLSITLNGFIGTDGVGTRGDTTNDGMNTKMQFDWEYIQSFVGLNVKWLPNKNMHVHLVTSYNHNVAKVFINQAIQGTKKYSESFINEFGPVLNGIDQYSLSDFGFNLSSNQLVQQVQGKIETDLQINQNNYIAFGGEAISQFFNTDQNLKGWSIIETQNQFYEYRLIDHDESIKGNSLFNSAGFALWNVKSKNNSVSGELGFRIEHSYIWNKGFSINMWPVVNPRGNISWKIPQNIEFVDTLTFSLGSGIFSKLPNEALAATEKYGIKSFEVSPDRALFQVIGIEAKLFQSWLVRTEAYYKHYLNRLYLTGYVDTEINDYKVQAQTKGKGFSTGADIFIQKTIGKHIDGYLSYSFNYAQFYNASLSDLEGKTTFNGEPLDTWYYPSYHRFHTMHTVINIKPTQSITFTTKISLASGQPKQEVDSIIAYPVSYTDSQGNTQIIERYKQATKYSSTLRNDISCPVDFRLSFSNKNKHTRLNWEVYFGLENAFVNLYKPKTNKAFDEYTGKELENGDTADFDIGMPIPSFGLKISY